MPADPTPTAADYASARRLLAGTAQDLGLHGRHVALCDPCLDGKGGVCRVPGCLMAGQARPTYPIRDRADNDGSNAVEWVARALATARAETRAESAERIAELQRDAEAAAAAENANAADLRAARERIAALEAQVEAARAAGGREGRAMFVSALVSQLRTDVEGCGGRYTTIGAVIWMLADAIERGDCPSTGGAS